jgi:hypothetical protein
MIPTLVFDECREHAQIAMAHGRPVNRTAAVIIVVLWVLAVAAVIWFTARRVGAK